MNKSVRYRSAQGQKTNGDWNELDDMCVTRDVLNSDNSNFVMPQLKGDTYYRIELRAYNAIGFSQPATLLMRTAQGESTNVLGTLSYGFASRSSFGGSLTGGAGRTVSGASTVPQKVQSVVAVVFALLVFCLV